MPKTEIRRNYRVLYKEPMHQINLLHSNVSNGQYTLRSTSTYLLLGHALDNMGLLSVGHVGAQQVDNCPMHVLHIQSLDA